MAEQQVCLHLWNNACDLHLTPEALGWWCSASCWMHKLVSPYHPPSPITTLNSVAVLLLHAAEAGFLGSLLRSGTNSCRHLQRPTREKQIPHTAPSTSPPHPQTPIPPLLLSHAQDRLEAVDKLSARSAVQRSPGVLALTHTPLINSPASGAFRRGAEGLQVICFNHFRPPEREEQRLNYRPIMTPHLKLSGNQSQHLVAYCLHSKRLWVIGIWCKQAVPDTEAHKKVVAVLA